MELILYDIKYRKAGMNRFHYAIIISLVLFSIASVFFFIPAESDFFSAADEGCYLRFAKAVSENGLGQFPYLIKYYSENIDSHLFPTPSRAGHILLTAIWLKLFGVSFTSLAWFSFSCYILFILACFYFSLKFFDKDIAYPFTLLVSSSPLIMAMGKRALADSTTNLFWALSIWTFMDFIISNKKSKLFIFAAVYSFCIIVKESSLVLTIFFALFFLLYKYYLKKPISTNYAILSLGIPIITAGVSLIALSGGIANFINLIKAVLDTHCGSAKLSDYAVLFCSGPWYRYIIDYLLLSPITTLLFIGYFGHVLASGKFEWKKIYFLLYFSIILAVFGALKHNKDVRLVVNMDMAIDLCSVWMLYELFKWKDPQKQALAIFISVAGIYLLNYSNFITLFCQYNIYDPITYWLLAAKKIIPYR